MCLCAYNMVGVYVRSYMYSMAVEAVWLVMLWPGNLLAKEAYSCIMYVCTYMHVNMHQLLHITILTDSL